MAPISWPIPPTGYGPWERVTCNLTEELVRLGHDVTLFASGGSTSTARVIHTVPYALETWPEQERQRARRQDVRTGYLEGPIDHRILEELHIATTVEHVLAEQFDVLHSHLHVHALPFGRFLNCPLVSTLHGSAWVRSAHPMFLAHRDMPYVSISNAERQLLPALNYVATVYNGIRVDDFPFQESKEDYLLFAGRLSPEKGAAEAVRVALEAGRRLIMAGMIEEQYQDYYNTSIKPFVDGRNIEYAGLLSQKDLAPLYQRAAAVLFLINWCEPFGMVAVEAQASGTPLIATRFGALPEIIREGVTGYVVDTLDEAVAAVGKLDRLSPAACRENAVTRFSAPVMARGYAAVYARLAESSAWADPAVG